MEERTAPEPYRYLVLSYRQPADHRDPFGGSFEQRFTLLHKSTDRPMLLHTSGYNVRISPTRSEPARLVDGNQISGRAAVLLAALDSFNEALDRRVP